MSITPKIGTNRLEETDICDHVLTIQYKIWMELRQQQKVWSLDDRFKGNISKKNSRKYRDKYLSAGWGNGFAVVLRKMI